MELQTLHISIKAPRPLILEATCSDGRPFLDLTGLEKVSIDLKRQSVSHRSSKVSLERFNDLEMSVFELMVCEEIEYLIYWLVLSDEFYLADNFHFRDVEFAKTITESLQTLRRLNLAIIVLSEYPDPLVGLFDELEEISGRNKLERIEIDLEVGYEYEAYDEWHRLENVLIKSGWPELKCVSITIIFLRPIRQPSNGLSRLRTYNCPV